MSIYDTTTTPLAPTPEQVAPAPAVPMTPAVANQVLAQYGVNPANVLSATNIASTVTKPKTAPDDLLGIRADISKELGLDTQNTAYQNALAAARTRVTDLNKTTALMEGQRVNLGVIRGEQGQERNLAVPEIQALQDQAAFERDKLNALTAERDYRTGVAEKNIDFTRGLKLQYAGAKISYGDSMDTIEKKLVKYQKDQKKEAEKDAIKQLYLQTFGSTGRGKSTKDMEKKLKKEFSSKKDYERAVQQNTLASNDISLALQRIQLQKAQAETKPLDIAALFSKPAANPSQGLTPDSSSGMSASTFLNYLRTQ